MRPGEAARCRLPCLRQADVFNRDRGEVRERRELGGVLRRELRRPATPYFQHASHLVLGQKRDRERRLDPLRSREIEKIPANHLAVDIVFDHAHLPRLEHSTPHPLPRSHAEQSGFRGEVADASLHDEPLILLQHDAADVGREARLCFVRDLREDLVQVVALEDTVRYPLKNLDRLELVGIAVPAVTGPNREGEDPAQSLEPRPGGVIVLRAFENDYDARTADRARDQGAKANRRSGGMETFG